MDTELKQPPPTRTNLALHSPAGENIRIELVSVVKREKCMPGVEILE